MRKFLCAAAGIMLFVICVSGQDTAAVPDTMEAQKSAEGESEQAGTGTLSISSQPSDAVVVVDDVMRGRTPLAVEGLSAGEHIVVLKKTGYFLKKATVAVSADTTLQLAFELSRPLRVVITSEPAGAQVSVDGSPVGTSPCVVEKLAPAEHTISILLNGYEEAQKVVNLSGQSSDTLHFDLVRTAGADEAKARAMTEESNRGKIAGRVALVLFLVFTLTIIIVELSES